MIAPPHPPQLHKVLTAHWYFVSVHHSNLSNGSVVPRSRVWIIPVCIHASGGEISSPVTQREMQKPHLYVAISC